MPNKNNDISFDFETMIVVTDEKAVSRLVLKDCSTFIQLLRGVIRDEVRAAIPDQLINATHAKEILQVKHISSVQRYIESGKLTNYGTGTKRPKLSLRQVTQLKIEKQTTEIN